jgi:hypothetical protein
VLPQSEGRKRYNHSIAGLIIAEHFTFSMTDNPDLRITVFSPVDHKSMAKNARDDCSSPERLVGKKSATK